MMPVPRRRLSRLPCCSNLLSSAQSLWNFFWDPWNPPFCLVARWTERLQILIEERLGLNVRIGEGSRRPVAVRWWPGWLLLFLRCPLEFRNNLANWPSIKPLFRPYRTWFETGCFCALYSKESLLLRVSAACWVCWTNEDKISDPWLKPHGSLHLPKQ